MLDPIAILISTVRTIEGRFYVCDSLEVNKLPVTDAQPVAGIRRLFIMFVVIEIHVKVRSVFVPESGISSSVWQSELYFSIYGGDLVCLVERLPKLGKSLL